jgi:hypothetical protein
MLICFSCSKPAHSSRLRGGLWNFALVYCRCFFSRFAFQLTEAHFYGAESFAINSILKFASPLHSVEMGERKFMSFKAHEAKKSI